MKVALLLLLALAGSASAVQCSSLHAHVEFESTLHTLDALSDAVLEHGQHPSILAQHDAIMQDSLANIQAAQEQDMAMLEMGTAATATVRDDDGSEEEGGDESKNPSYTLPYPPVMYAHLQHGGFFHPYSNVNPLGAPWAGFAPVASPARFHPSAAAVYHSPLTAALHGHALYHGAALGINSHLHPQGYWHHPTNAKGGYNVHGLTPGSPWGYHPGLNKDLTNLGGKAADDDESGESGESEEGGEEEESGDDSFLEQGQQHGQGEMEDMNQEATDKSYGLYPAPLANTATTYVRSDEYAVGPHSSQIAFVGENEAADFPQLIQLGEHQYVDAAQEQQGGDCVNCVFN